MMMIKTKIRNLRVIVPRLLLRDAAFHARCPFEIGVEGLDELNLRDIGDMTAAGRSLSNPRSFGIKDKGPFNIE